jgi:YD repeat-containing protein
MLALPALLAPSAQAAGAQAIRSFPIPTEDSQPIEIALGPDGNMWLTEQNASKVGQVTPRGRIREIRLPTFGFPNDITAGPDGNIWVAEGSNGQIGRITPNGQISEFEYDPFGSSSGITTGPDGNIWFTGGDMWRLDLTTFEFTRFPIPANRFPGDITTGADGNLWFTEVDRIGRMTPDGQYTEHGVGQSLPFAITLGPDGNVWFTERFNQRIAKVTPDGQFTFYSTTLHTLDSIVTGADGNLWFTAFGDDRIARITTTGEVTPGPVVPGSGPTGIAPGPNRTVWFLGYSSNTVYATRVP